MAEAAERGAIVAMLEAIEVGEIRTFEVTGGDKELAASKRNSLCVSITGVKRRFPERDFKCNLKKGDDGWYVQVQRLETSQTENILAELRRIADGVDQILKAVVR